MRVVRDVRQAGHDIQAVSDLDPGASDERVMEMAAAGDRILLTEDRDFGRLLYARRLASAGVIYMRYPHGVRAKFGQEVVDLMRKEGERLRGAFVVMQPGRARVGRLPG